MYIKCIYSLFNGFSLIYNKNCRNFFLIKLKNQLYFGNFFSPILSYVNKKQDTPCDDKSCAIYSVYIILDLYYVERRRNIPQPPSPVSPSIYLQFRT